MSPLKVYGYLAGSRPVVATDLPPVRRIVRMRKGESIADSIADSLDRGLLSDERQGFIGADPWQGRHDELLAVALGISALVPNLPAADAIVGDAVGGATETGSDR
jgi:teichuronic acid biosynthesis glycosyltransferase TuaH